MKTILAPMNKIIHKKMQEVLEDYNARGVLIGTPAMDGFIDEKLKLTKEILQEALNKVAELNPGNREWKQIELAGRDFIEFQHEETVRKVHQLWWKYYGDLRKQEVKAMKTELLADLDFFIEKETKKNKRIRLEKWHNAICSTLRCIILKR